MNVEDTRWFRLVTVMVAFGTVWWLSALVGVWPNGPQSISAALLFLFCLSGAVRFYDTFLGIAVIAISPGRRPSPTHRHH